MPSCVVKGCKNYDTKFKKEHEISYHRASLVLIDFLKGTCTMEGQGMIAVVRGLTDAGLAVTLLEGDRQYTLMPNTANNATGYQKQYASGDRRMGDSGYPVLKVDSGAQAVDDRYATTYKMMHCKMSPTSPPVQVAKFPPQRADGIHGHSNFEVGGYGSRDNHRPIKSNCYRGGMVWSDRGSVCCPRASDKLDAFATSLRKYPQTSPDRSSEVFERLINYSQRKTLNKPSMSRNQTSPRFEETCNNNYRRHINRSRAYDYDIHIATNQVDEYPTRDSNKNQGNNNMKNHIPGRGNQQNNNRYQEPYRQYHDSESWCRGTGRCQNPIGRYHHSGYQEQEVRYQNGGRWNVRDAGNMDEMGRRHRDQVVTNHNSNNMEVQAGVKMVSREAETTPHAPPSRRSVSTLISPSPSFVGKCTQCTHTSFKSIQTSTFNVKSEFRKKSVQTFSSSINIRSRSLQKWALIGRKSKSEEEIVSANYETKNYLNNLLEDVSDYCKSRRTVRDDLVKNLFAIETKRDDFIKEFCSNNSNFHDGCHLKFNHSLQLEKSISNVPKFCYSHRKFSFFDDHSNHHKVLRCVKPTIYNYRNKMTNVHKKSFGNVKTTNIQEDLKFFVRKLLLDFYNSSYVKISKSNLENTIINVLYKSIANVSNGDEDELRNNVKYILQENGQITEQKSVSITNFICYRLKKMLHQSNFDHTYTVNYSKLNSTRDDDDDHNPEFSEEDTHTNGNLDNYILQIREKINEWLNNLDSCLVNELDKTGFRPIIVNDLAGDIVDRYKYLELNPNIRGSSDEELNILKFQIFKWINRLTGENNMEAVNNARELMEIIKSVPAPNTNKSLNTNFTSYNDSPWIEDKQDIGTLTRRSSNHSIIQLSEPSTSYGNPTANPTRTIADPSLPADLKVCNSAIPTTSESCSPPIQEKIPAETLSTPIPGSSSYSCCPTLLSISNRAGYSTIPFPPCCHGKENSGSITPTIKQLYDEYDEFVKNWVQQIKIPATNPSENKVAEKIRTKIYNGVWKALTKLSCDLESSRNPYYYQTVLDDEIEELFNDYLPNVKNDSERQRLKSELINKVTEINIRISKLYELVSYKELLIQQINNHLPRSQFSSEILKQKQEALKLDIVDAYILYKLYQNDDELKSNVYRKSLFNRLQQLIQTFKNYNFNKETCMYEIIDAISKVPLPNEAHIIMQEEAQKIMIGKEIEHWISDLPTQKVPPLKKLRIKDVILEKILDIQAQMDVTDCVGINELKKTLPKYLKKLPLDDEADLNFLIEELANRLRKISNNIGKKSVSFQEPQDFEDFSRNLALGSCSSQIEEQSPKSTLCSNGNKGSDATTNYNENLSTQPSWYSLQEGESTEGKFFYQHPNLNACNEDCQATGPLTKGIPETAPMSQIRDNCSSYVLPANIKGETQWLSLQESRISDVMKIDQKQEVKDNNINDNIKSMVDQNNQTINLDTFNHGDQHSLGELTCHYQAPSFISPSQKSFNSQSIRPPPASCIPIQPSLIKQEGVQVPSTADLSGLPKPSMRYRDNQMPVTHASGYNKANPLMATPETSTSHSLQRDPRFWTPIGQKRPFTPDSLGKGGPSNVADKFTETKPNLDDDEESSDEEDYGICKCIKGRFKYCYVPRTGYFNYPPFIAVPYYHW